MKKNIVKLFSLIVAIFMIFSFSFVYANNELESQISKTDYSEEYKEWQKLSDEEKENSIMPRKYDIIKSQDNATYLKNLKNIFRMQMLLKGPLMDSYNLKDVIPENTTIRNQMNTNSCWAFASLGALETNLAMRDYNSSKGPVVYDFSEKHMNYATAKSSFLDNKTNEYGFSKEVSEGGNFYMATQYLTNGLGAIDEEDLPFENSEEDIDISEIQNKEVKTTLYDTVEFESVDPSEKEVVMDSMKEHIANYGGIYAGISGASIFGDNYNNETGAMYCSDSSSNPIDHAVTIIGWDDNYSLDNFNENNRPTANGAWIVKNSWGEEITENLLTIKEMLFNEDPSYWEELTYDSPEKIPTDIVVNAYKQIYGESKVEVRDDNLVIKIGNDGYMYVSYEDCNVYTTLSGIEKATNSKDYDNVYQNDILGVSNNIAVFESGKVYLANVFTRDSSVQEVLDKISVYTFQGYNCKVLVNPNGDSKNIDDLQEVRLKEGDTVSVEPGFHTIEFVEPVRLTGDKFVVVLEVTSDSSPKQVALESRTEDSYWKDAIVNEGESFCANEDGFSANVWTDLATIQDDLKGNLCIKGYTTLSEETETPEEPENPDPEEPENPGTDTDEPEDNKPVSSNFRNAISQITKAEIHFYTENAEQTKQGTITIKVSGIQIGDETNSYTHYYYISGTQGDKNITNWKEMPKMVKESDGTYSITLTIKQDEILAIENLIDYENLYLYVREVATAGNKSVEQISELVLDIAEDADIKGYVDGELVGGVDDVIDDTINGNVNNVNSGNTGNGVQNTNNSQRPTALPHAGSTVIVIALVIAIIAFGGFAYFRYKNIDR